MQSVSEMLSARQRDAARRETIDMIRGAIAGVVIGAIIALPLGYLGVKLIASAAATAVQADSFTGGAW